MPDDFFERTQYLMDQVGDGDLTAGCLVDQPYAQDQHETLHYNHPRGGRARYLGGPLFENALPLMEKIAANAITRDGSDLNNTFIGISETMSEWVVTEAPRLLQILRFSGEPWVKDGGNEIYRRRSAMPREPDA